MTSAEKETITKENINQNLNAKKERKRK